MNEFTLSVRHVSPLNRKHTTSNTVKHLVGNLPPFGWRKTKKIYRERQGKAIRKKRSQSNHMRVNLCTCVSYWTMLKFSLSIHTEWNPVGLMRATKKKKKEKRSNKKEKSKKIRRIAHAPTTKKCTEICRILLLY